MVKNITGVIDVLAWVFIIYKLCVCFANGKFKVLDIILIVVMVIIIVADFIVRKKFAPKA